MKNLQMNEFPYDLRNMSEADLVQLRRNLQIKSQGLAAKVQARAEAIRAPAGATKYMDILGSGDAMTINNVIWPFNFVAVSDDVISANGGLGKATFQVTQEAAFVWTSLTKVVYAVDFDAETPTINYINPRDITGNGDANGLKFALVDGSSSRAFQNDPVPLDQIGNPFQPFIPDRPQLLLPLQQMDINFVNENPDRDFVAFMIFQGYRIRLEGQKDLAELVTG